MEEERKVEHRKFERGELAKYLTISQVAERLGLSRPTIYSMVKKGKLPASLIGGQWFVAPAAVDALLPASPPETEGAQKKEEKENG